MAQTVILQSMVRSGTTYLRDMLSRHPQLAVLGEVLFPDYSEFGWYAFFRSKYSVDHSLAFPHRQKELFRDYIEETTNSHDKLAVIIDVKLEQINDSPTIGQELHVGREGRRFLLLKRTNYLKQVISEMLMYKRLHSGDAEVHREYTPPPARVTVNAADIVSRMRWNASLMQRYTAAAVASGAPCLTVLYEDLVGESCEYEIQRIEKFIGVDVIPLAAKLAKQNPQPLNQLVENYHELYELVRNSEFAYCLNLPS